MEGPISKLRLVGVHKDKHRLYEWQPMVRTVKIGPRFGGHFNNKKNYTLAFPFVQILFKKWKGWDNFWSFHLSYTNDPIENLESEVYFAPFLNVYHPTHQVCLNTGNWGGRVLSDRDIITQYWLSEFHDNGQENYWKCYSYLKNLPMQTLEGWEKMTADDPSFILDVPWPDKTSIPAIIQEKSMQSYTCFQMKQDHEIA